MCAPNQPNKITISKPGEENSHNHGHNHSHDHENGHHHHHSHDHTHTDSNGRIIELGQDIMQFNDVGAARNRGYFDAKELKAFNFVSSPGSGKTTILEKTLADLKDKILFYVIEGDQQTMNDANRIDALNIPVSQINTGALCHLESDMVYEAVKSLNPAPKSVLMIENVGNLVCPAKFNLGEDYRIVIVSTTEGDDKPIKYPDMFEGSQVCIINKIDLLPYLNFDVEKAKDYASKVNPNLIFFEVSATTGEGMDKWYEWFLEQVS
ncbi:MAG TPA: hydrogenase accessory protein HypB [Bacteroidetes bacterium]|nr:hydrogenase accessory protein HypB [Bacteroidota bacterium]